MVNIIRRYNTYNTSSIFLKNVLFSISRPKPTLNDDNIVESVSLNSL